MYCMKINRLCIPGSGPIFSPSANCHLTQTVEITYIEGVKNG